MISSFLKKMKSRHLKTTRTTKVSKACGKRSEQSSSTDWKFLAAVPSRYLSFACHSCMSSSSCSSPTLSLYQSLLTQATCQSGRISSSRCTSHSSWYLARCSQFLFGLPFLWVRRKVACDKWCLWMVLDLMSTTLASSWVIYCSTWALQLSFLLLYYPSMKSWEMNKSQLSSSATCFSVQP